MFVLFSMLFLAGGLYYFQIVNSDTYVRLASNNRLRLIRFPPVRGEIYDRNGALLAVNVTTFDIMGYPMDIERNDMVERMAELLSRHGIPVTAEDLSRTIKRQYWAPYRVVRLVGNITLAQMADLVADPEFPKELFPLPVWRRTYPAGSLASNITGYVGEISENELRQMEGRNYVAGDLVGKNGIERQYEETLRGTPGEESVEVDARGRKVKTIHVRTAGKGQDLRLTLDLGAQRLAADLMKGYHESLVGADCCVSEAALDACRAVENDKVELLPEHIAQLFHLAGIDRFLGSCLGCRQQEQVVDPLVSHKSLVEPACSLQNVDEVVDDPVLQPHHNVKVSQPDVRIHRNDLVSGPCEGHRNI
jgi:cell division protein FtsI/penicillin-binding protein 2